MGNKEWSKSYLAKPEDQIISHAKIKAPKFIPTYERNCCPTDMNWLLGWEYGRIWLKERSDFVQKLAIKEKPKRIKNDYENWLKNRSKKPKKPKTPSLAERL